jgi:hypothetical protein
MTPSILTVKKMQQIKVSQNRKVFKTVNSEVQHWNQSCQFNPCIITTHFSDIHFNTFTNSFLVSELNAQPSFLNAKVDMTESLSSRILKHFNKDYS